MQEETKKRAYMPDVPRPAVHGWGVALICIGIVLAFFGGMGGSNEDYDAQAFSASLTMFGACVSATGFALLLLGLLIHAIRVEGAAIRAGVLSPYPESLPRLPAHTEYHGKGQ